MQVDLYSGHRMVDHQVHNTIIWGDFGPFVCRVTAANCHRGLCNGTVCGRPHRLKYPLCPQLR